MASAEKSPIRAVELPGPVSATRLDSWKEGTGGSPILRPTPFPLRPRLQRLHHPFQRPPLQHVIPHRRQAQGLRRLRGLPQSR